MNVMSKSVRNFLVILVTCSLLLIPLLTAMSYEAPLPNNIHPELVKKNKMHPDKLVSVIVGTTNFEEVKRKASKLGIKITSSWKFIHAFAAQLPAAKLPALATLSGVKMVTIENTVYTSGKPGSSTTSGAVNYSNLTNAYNYAIKADQVWDMGYDGKGVTVAVVDSGISTGSDTATDFGSRIIYNVKFNSTTSNQSDKFGHGTHIAGIIGGNGSQANGKYIGVAPGVNLINVKFSSDEGIANEQDLVNALQWVYDNRTSYNIRVVNISSSVGTKQSYKDSATAAAVEQLWFAGVVVVVSAGNTGGESCSTCSAPSNDPYVISVGAIDDNGTKGFNDDYAKNWSSNGTTLDGHYRPDIMAPGARIISYMPTGTLRDKAIGNLRDTVYFQMGGTSMAAPMVTGVVALMLQSKPNLTPNEVKWILMNTTRSYSFQKRGTPGIVDAYSAVTYSGSIGKANQGLTPSPLLNPSTKTISYSNMAWANMAWANMAWANSTDF